MTDAQIREYLRDNGYPEHIVRGGRLGLVNRWRQFVEEVERGYEFGLEDYRNDLDVRAIIRLIGAEEEIRDADERFRAMLIETDIRVWESAAGNPWWDFGYPRNTTAALKYDLRAEDLFR